MRISMHVFSLFYQQIRGKKEEEILGRNVRRMMQRKGENRDYSFKNKVNFQSMKKEIIQLQQYVNSKLPGLYALQDRPQYIQTPPVFQQNHPVTIIQRKYTKYRKQVSGGMLQDHLDTIQIFFTKPIYNIQKLYIASKEQFSASRFHQKCDGINNTLTLAKTQYGNMVGGFCSLPWQSPTNWVYKNDQSKQTFLFSLHSTLKGLKFQPIKSKFTIGIHKDYGPCFGDDLVIYDKSSTSKACWSNFPDCYQCSTKTIKHDLSSIRAWVGVEDHYRKFNVVEWEVYKVSFQEGEELQRSFMKIYRAI